MNQSYELINYFDTNYITFRRSTKIYDGTFLPAAVGGIFAGGNIFLFLVSEILLALSHKAEMEPQDIIPGGCALYGGRGMESVWLWRSGCAVFSGLLPNNGGSGLFHTASGEVAKNPEVLGLFIPERDFKRGHFMHGFPLWLF